MELQLSKFSTARALFALTLSFIAYNCNCSIDVYSDAERVALDKFRPIVNDMLYQEFMKEDTYLIIWLRARNLNLDEAKLMLHKAIEWRKMNNIDTILDEDFSTMKKEFPIFHDSVDKKGRPVLIVLIGQYDIRKVVLAGKRELFNRYLEYNYELGRQKTNQLNVTQGVMILDLYGLNRRNQACLQCLPVFVHFVTAYENYFPQLCHRFYLINTPKVFEIIYQVITPLQSNQTKERYEIHDHNKDEWSKSLLRDIDASQLPVRFGGTKRLQFSHSD